MGLCNSTCGFCAKTNLNSTPKLEIKVEKNKFEKRNAREEDIKRIKRMLRNKRLRGNV